MLAVVGVAPPACSAAQRPSGPAAPRAAAWSFEAGLDPSLYVRFRGLTYVEEPAVQWLAGATAAAPASTASARRGALVRVVDDDGPGRPPELGHAALALSIPAGGRVLVHTPVVTAAPPEVRLAVWLRTDAPGGALLRLFRSVASGAREYGGATAGAGHA